MGRRIPSQERTIRRLLLAILLISLAEIFFLVLRFVFFSSAHSFAVHSLVWALIRVRDESLFPQMLRSIEPLFYYGVIAWQTDDNTSSVVSWAFCRSHPGFICYEYPFDVLPAGDSRYFRSPAPDRRLDV
jgi:hypothetical protein